MECDAWEEIRQIRIRMSPWGHGKDFWEKVAEKYGTDIAEKLKAFGDDVADIIGRLSDAEVKQAVELINEYGDDVVELFKDGKSISQVKASLKGGSGSGYTVDQSMFAEDEAAGIIEIRGGKIYRLTMKVVILNQVMSV